MKGKLKLFLQGWLSHLFVLLTTILLFSFFGRHNQAETIWHYFARHTINSDTLLIVVITLLAEICYQHLLKKLNLALFICTCLLAGLISLLVIISTKPVNFGQRNILDFIEPVLFIAGYTLAYTLLRNYLYTITRKKDVELQKFKHELDALKAQLNPHFLFNSLNYLYGTALNEKATQTAEGIDQLSEMMRYTITGIHENFVPLKHELKFIKHYLALQQARLPEKDSINITVQLPAQIPTLQIAPLLLLPFIENAFKYGINMDEPCFVNINLSIADTTLIMNVRNSITAKPIELTGNNTGIKNTVKRLNLLYPGNYQLEQTDNAAQYSTTLQLQLQN